ncbi:CPCC family cysteine-rich protein [Myroides odoratus]|uniref:CPCC family cysteine-rich protein n=1 Tax=Myroides odoratus TaxID=256 RepID=UPI0007660219|nr:CPCC family cysteine-rich protein [Myroides odoratus]
MSNKKNKKHACPCCGYFTLNNNVGNTFQLCLVCYWEDDGIQFEDPSYEGGANRVSLIQAKENFKSFGASEREFLQYVRPPLKEEN